MKKILYSITLILTNLILIISCKKEDLGIQYGKGVSDIIGNNYKTVIIGKQEWMAENLRTTKYNDGSKIPNVIDPNQWIGLTTGASSSYNNTKNDSTYGKLYNWYAVNTCKLCPTGWHVPTDAEWEDLSNYLAANGHKGSEGTALKSKSGWKSNGNGTDNYGWNGLPGGHRDYYAGDFYKIGQRGYWWSSSVNGTFGNYPVAWYRKLYYEDNIIGRYPFNMRDGLSIRCLRD